MTKEEFNKMIQQINDYQDESYPKKTIIWGCGIGGTLIGFSLTALLGAFLTSLLYLISLLSIIPIVGAYFLIIYLNQSVRLFLFLSILFYLFLLFLFLFIFLFLLFIGLLLIFIYEYL